MLLRRSCKNEKKQFTLNKILHVSESNRTAASPTQKPPPSPPPYLIPARCCVSPRRRTLPVGLGAHRHAPPHPPHVAKQRLPFLAVISDSVLVFGALGGAECGTSKPLNHVVLCARWDGGGHVSMQAGVFVVVFSSFAS